MTGKPTRQSVNVTSFLPLIEIKWFFFSVANRIIARNKTKSPPISLMSLSKQTVWEWACDGPINAGMTCLLSIAGFFVAAKYSPFNRMSYAVIMVKG